LIPNVFNAFAAASPASPPPTIATLHLDDIHNSQTIAEPSQAGKLERRRLLSA
jgi:hypothetical protein